MSEPTHAHTHEHHHEHGHDHGHSQDHHHHGEDNYFIDQLCMVGLCGAFGVICLCLYFWQQAMLKILLEESFHKFVLMSGIGLTIFSFARGWILWQQSRDPAFLHSHHHHHEHDHGQQQSREHDHGIKPASSVSGVQSLPLPTAPCGHDHAPGESCDHGHDHAHAHSHAHEHHIGQAHAQHDHDEADHDHGWAPWRYVVILVPIILFLLGLPNHRPSITDTGAEKLLSSFTSIIYEAMPFIVLGVIIAGLLEEFVPQQAIAKIVPKNRFLAVGIGALLGLIFPMCECGIIVVMKRLLRKGLPLGVCVAYMLAGPVINVVVMTSTYVAFSSYNEAGKNDVLGGPYAVIAWRVGLSYLVAFITAVVVDWQWTRFGKRLLHPSVLHGLKDAGNTDDAEAGSRPWRERLDNITQTALHDFVDILAFLTLGAVLAAFGKFVIREANVEHFLQQTPALSILMMMGLAILFCLCSEADAFVAANFPLFWPDGSKLAFLVLGPMLDFKLLLMYTRVYRARLIYTIVICLIVQVFAYTMIVNALFGRTHPPDATGFSLSPKQEYQLLAVGMGDDPLTQLIHFAGAFVPLEHPAKGEPQSYKYLLDLEEKEDLRKEYLERRPEYQLVEIRGQFEPQPGRDDAFFLSRLKITCCNNDVTELRREVKAREGVPALQKGNWIRVTGRIRFQSVGPTSVRAVLVVQRTADIVPSDPDQDPYVK